jgi:hypothetical protein
MVHDATYVNAFTWIKKNYKMNFYTFWVLKVTLTFELMDLNVTLHLVDMHWELCGSHVVSFQALSYEPIWLKSFPENRYANSLLDLTLVRLSYEPNIWDALTL